VIAPSSRNPGPVSLAHVRKLPFSIRIGAPSPYTRCGESRPSTGSEENQGDPAPRASPARLLAEPVSVSLPLSQRSPRALATAHSNCSRRKDSRRRATTAYEPSARSLAATKSTTSLRSDASRTSRGTIFGYVEQMLRSRPPDRWCVRRDRNVGPSCRVYLRKEVAGGREILDHRLDSPIRLGDQRRVALDVARFQELDEAGVHGAGGLHLRHHARLGGSVAATVLSDDIPQQQGYTGVVEPGGDPGTHGSTVKYRGLFHSGTHWHLPAAAASGRFEDHRDPHTAADALRRQRVTSLFPLEQL